MMDIKGRSKKYLHDSYVLLECMLHEDWDFVRVTTISLEPKRVPGIYDRLGVNDETSYPQEADN